MTLRIRTDQPLPRYDEVTRHCTVGGSTVAATNVPMYVNTKYMSDHVTKGYKQRIAAGEIINNPCSFTSHTEESKGSYTASGKLNENQTCSYTGGSISYFACSESWIPASGLSDTTNVEVAKLAALANMDKTQYAFGEDLGEIGKTLRFMKNPIKSLTTLAKDYRTVKYSKMRKGMRAAQASAEAFAAHQWALQPLMRSVEDLTLALLTSTGSLIKRSTSRGFDECNLSSSNDNYTELDPLIFSYKYIFEKEVRAYIIYESFRDDNATLKKYGLRMKDVPETAWQLFPLSFMMDRVINVSNVISAVQNITDPNLNILAGGIVTRTRTVKQWSVKQFYKDNIVVLCSPDDYSIEDFSYDRVPWSPSILDVVPPVTPGNLVKDTTSILESLAVLTGIFTNKK